VENVKTGRSVLALAGVALVARRRLRLHFALVERPVRVILEDHRGVDLLREYADVDVIAGVGQVDSRAGQRAKRRILDLDSAGAKQDGLAERGRAQVARFDAAWFFLQRRDDFVNSRNRAIVSAAQIHARVDLDVVDHLDGVLEIVKGDQGLHEQEENLGHAEGIFLVIGDAVELRDGIVGDVAERAAEKRRDARHRHGPVILEQLFQRFQWRVGLPFPYLAIGDQFNLVAARFENPLRSGAEK